MLKRTTWHFSSLWFADVDGLVSTTSQLGKMNTFLFLRKLTDGYMGSSLAVFATYCDSIITAVFKNYLKGC